MVKGMSEGDYKKVKSRPRCLLVKLSIFFRGALRAMQPGKPKAQQIPILPGSFRRVWEPSYIFFGGGAANHGSPEIISEGVGTIDNKHVPLMWSVRASPFSGPETFVCMEAGRTRDTMSGWRLYALVSVCGV